jgi:acetoin utilization deacetylase AcuC-like enzyme
MGWQTRARDLQRAARRASRRFRTRLRLAGARIVFHPGYGAELRGVLDGRRGERILSYLIEEGALAPEDVLVPRELPMRDALLVHTHEYLESLDRPETLAQMFPNVDSADSPAALFQAARLATGGTVMAAEWAVKHSFITTPILNLGGGFHHAKRAQGAGYCALADVAIAIAVLRRGGFLGRVLIVDLDAHHGDGNLELFADDPTVFTYSIHLGDLSRAPAVMNLDVELSPGTGDSTYLRALRETLDLAMMRARPAMAFYLAGADVAKNDLIGTFRLTDDAIARRDRFVLSTLTRIPTVVCLAGGYGPEAWRHPARTALWLLTGDDQPIASKEEVKLAAFRAIKSSLSPRKLRVGEDDDGTTLTEADLYGDLVQKRPTPGFLGFYSTVGLEVAAERYGLLAHLRARGYDPIVAVERDAAGRHTLRFFGGEDRAELLIELAIDTLFEHDRRLLSIEWLLLQDPRRTPDRPLLPGQKHPGLGCLDIVIGMLVMAAERLELDGLSLVPSQFHVAQTARKLFRFESPVAEARFLWLAQAVAHLPRVEGIAALLGGRVRERSSRAPIRYEPERMILPVSARMKEALDAERFNRAVEDHAATLPALELY